MIVDAAREPRVGRCLACLRGGGSTGVRSESELRSAEPIDLEASDTIETVPADPFLPENIARVAIDRKSVV